ncbi:unnamed protein product [Brassicogethes aeneus]|uniref:Uncharacterized protein n=1 Tax=Brassicogethes aeneus TaxID=1431903 RepID=A0A9P0AQA9_BRAAE|nr:unnamed protein product [Brassicogethes aeneus]
MHKTNKKDVVLITFKDEMEKAEALKKGREELTNLFSKERYGEAGPIAKFSKKRKSCDALDAGKMGMSNHSKKASKPVYWWNEEILETRKDSIRKRRIYTKSHRRNPLLENQMLWETYKESKTRLRDMIKKAKRNCWKTLCDKVNSDI